MSTLKVDTIDTSNSSGNITVSRPLAGSGASLTALNATELTSGTIPDARLPATLPAKSGVNLTALNATELTSGTIPIARIADNAITGAKIAMTSDARGDILYYNGTDYARLAKGSSGQVLKMGANDPAWGTDSAVDLTADQSWTGSQRATMVTDNDGSFDMNAGQNFNCTPSGNFTLTFTNIANGQSGFIILINSGGHTVSLHANSKADANLTGVVSTAGTYILSYISNGTNVYLTNSAVIA